MHFTPQYLLLKKLSNRIKLKANNGVAQINSLARSCLPAGRFTLSLCMGEKMRVNLICPILILLYETCEAVIQNHIHRFILFFFPTGFT